MFACEKKDFGMFIEYLEYRNVKNWGHWQTENVQFNKLALSQSTFVYGHCRRLTQDICLVYQNILIYQNDSGHRFHVLTQKMLHVAETMEIVPHE